MKFRELLAVVIGLVGVIGWIFMWQGEQGIIEDADFAKQVLPGLQQYSWGIGLTLLLASIGWILIGHEEDIATTSNDVEGKK